MFTIRHIDEVPFDKNSIVTVGTFDGIHIAHQDILSKVVAESSRRKSRSILVTFDPHPREVIAEMQVRLKLLTLLEERQDICSKMGIDYFFIINFDNNLAQLSFKEFYLKFLINGIGINTVVEGYNHHWGKGREGNIDSLFQLGKEYDFDVIRIEPFIHNGIPVNSSAIRNLLENGNIEEANRLLGRSYSLTGEVIHGDHRGSSLGFPTANIEISSDKKLIPKNGIYFVQVIIGIDKYFGITSIGYRPTFYSNEKVTIEVYILDFNQNIYGDKITLVFLKRMRDEVKYETANDLISQMNIDKEICLKLQLDYKGLV